VVFELWLHVGTMAAVIIFFRRDVAAILSSLVSRDSQDRDQRRLALLIVISTLVTGVIGVGAKGPLEKAFGSPLLAAAMLIITGGVLWLADRASGAEHGLPQMRITQAVLIGLAQGVAIIPGISRSGSTIAVAIFCGLERDDAARYSFLLSIPAVAGATLLEAGKLGSLLGNSGQLGALLAGVVCSLAAGYLAIGVVMRLVREKRLRWFAYYCFLVGGVSVAFFSI